MESSFKVGKFIPAILLLAHGAGTGIISDTDRFLFDIKAFIYRLLNLK